MTNAFVPESKLFTAGDHPLANVTLSGFDLGRRPSEVGYMPQLGFLALDDGQTKSLVGFRPEQGEENVLYSHPHAILGRRGASSVVELCSVPLATSPKIVDVRDKSLMSWGGRIRHGIKAITSPPLDISQASEGADIVIEPQPLHEALRQAAQSRTLHINRYLPSSIARVINPVLAVDVLGRRDTAISYSKR